MLTRNDATVGERARPRRDRAAAQAFAISASRMSAPTQPMLQEPDRGHSRSRGAPWMEIVATTREAELRGVELGRDLGVDLLMGGVHVEEALKLLGARRSAICRSPARRAAIRRGSAARRRKSRRNAGPSRQKAARASTFSLIAQPRPSRSTSSPPAGADFSIPAWSWSPEASIRRTRRRRSRRRERTPSPSARRRSRLPTRPAPGRSRRSSRRCSPIAARRLDESDAATRA